MTDDPFAALHRLAHRLDATPLELVGLAVLLAGGVALTLLWGVLPRGDGGHGPSVSAASTSPGAVAPTPAGSDEGAATVTVHVTGAVARPGVVTVPADTRVTDVLAAAGGALVDADLDAVNLAALVTDGTQLVVPRLGEAPPAGAVDSAAASDELVDLNSADAAALEELPSIGPVLAQRIVDYRDEHGPFTAVGQLRDVAGIGERTFQGLVDLVMV